MNLKTAGLVEPVQLASTYTTARIIFLSCPVPLTIRDSLARVPQAREAEHEEKRELQGRPYERFRSASTSQIIATRPSELPGFGRNDL